MSADKPKSPPAQATAAPLKDLPAQPVDPKEAEGIKGGLAAAPPDPVRPVTANPPDPVRVVSATTTSR